MKEKFSVNIIGSGIGSLFCGAILAKHGFKVQIYEAGARLGGNLSSWKRDGYTFETPQYELDAIPNSLKLRVFSFLGLLNHLTFSQHDSLYTSFFAEGAPFSAPRGMAAFREKLEWEFPQEIPAVRKVFFAIERMATQAFMYLQDDTSRNSSKSFFCKSPYLIRGSFLTSEKLMCPLQHPRLRAVVSQLLAYYSDSTCQMNALSFSMMAHSYLSSSCRIKGTLESLIEALVDIIRENGGSMHLRCSVSQVLFDKKKAVGIEMTGNGERHFSDLTICNSSLISAFQNLIPKADFGRRWRRKALKTAASTLAFCVHLGLNASAKELGISDHCIVMNNEPHRLSRPIFFYHCGDNEGTAPVGKSTAKLVMMDSLSCWENRQDRLEYQAEKMRIKHMMIERAAEYFPKLKEHIETMETEFIYGREHEWYQVNSFRFPERNLYFPGSVASTIFCAQMILNHYGIKNFVTEDAMTVKCEHIPSVNRFHHMKTCPRFPE